jgi:hypothetical protein
MRFLPDAGLPKIFQLKHYPNLLTAKFGEPSHQELFQYKLLHVAAGKHGDRLPLLGQDHFLRGRRTLWRTGSHKRPRICETALQQITTAGPLGWAHKVHRYGTTSSPRPNQNCSVISPTTHIAPPSNLAVLVLPNAKSRFQTACDRPLARTHSAKCLPRNVRDGVKRRFANWTSIDGAMSQSQFLS